MSNIGVVIHTHNEEKNILECINSARLLTNNIIIVDMESTDETTKIAKKQDIVVLRFPFSHYVEPARRFGIKQTQARWVFILDADEHITPNLAKEVKEKIEDTDCSFFKVPRKNIFGGKKWLKHGNWWPDYQIRLINKEYFIEWPSEIHSTPVIKGKCCKLNNPLDHLFHGDISSMVKKTIIFEQIESNLLFKAHRKVRVITFFRKFFGELYRRLIKHKGFLDGKAGIIESVYQAYSKTITYLFLYEQYLKEKSSSV